MRSFSILTCISNSTRFKCVHFLYLLHLLAFQTVLGFYSYYTYFDFKQYKVQMRSFSILTTLTCISNSTTFKCVHFLYLLAFQTVLGSNAFIFYTYLHFKHFKQYYVQMRSFSILTCISNSTRFKCVHFL